ncbi:MAG: SgcJ/EcaC family oxidoreductase [Candidatus Omnitrophica bacterium]|nr:SgcJ/EcaC family oxidoreductase [Candidatus Omnitrophota bacterium]MCA9434746.1 SgcJ/EcaC family oxidoreductase [Candidatus Omnitrophota bacterium]
MKRIPRWFTFFAFLLIGQVGNATFGASEEEAIRATAEEYAKAFNAGDVDSIVSLWSDDGDFIDGAGKSFRGKDAIRSELKDFFAKYPKASMKIVIDTIHVDSPELAIEDGITQVRADPNGNPVNTRYTVVHVKEGDRWVMQSVREGAAVAPSNYDRLKGLEWMVGDWVDQGEGGESVQSSCDWSVHKNFLIRTFTTVFEGGNATSGTQTIGWDPSDGSIKSWTFDTNGGITTGVWSKEGDKWHCQVATVLRGGEKFTATEVLSVVDENTHTWQSVDRHIDGDSLPDTEVVTITRQ